jgi:hypothetical protein
MLDVFHGVQRITSTVLKKEMKGNKTQFFHDLSMMVRKPGDTGNIIQIFIGIFYMGIN